jgi:hypothetical protein
MRARTQGKQLSGDWIDYFVFRKGLYKELPDLVIGRVFWDQWLVWKARASGAALLDATDAVTAIHQNHDYGYHPGERECGRTSTRSGITSWPAGDGTLAQSMMRHTCWDRMVCSRIP